MNSYLPNEGILITIPTTYVIMPERIRIEKSVNLFEKALQLIPGGSQTSSKRPSAFAPGAYPIYVDRGKGCHVWDVDGNEYIDYVLALGPLTLGYCYPAIDEAVKRQLEKGIIFGLLHPLEIEAAEAITEVVPCAEMVRFFKTGAEAISAAVRVARAYTGRDKVATYGYHGWHDTWACTSASPAGDGIPAVLKDYVHPFNYNDFDSPASLKAVLEQHPNEFACIVMEPISYWERPKETYLQRVKELAERHGALLVFDEIVTGFRLALGGAQELLHITPDLAVVGKGVAAGMPLSAVVGRRKYMERMTDLLVSITHGGEALSLAASVAAIREYKEKGVQAYLWQRGEEFMNAMNELALEAGVSMEWGGYPPMPMYKFNVDDPSLADDLMTLWLQENARRGILYRRGGPAYICFSHSDEDINITIEVGGEVMKCIDDALRSKDVKSRLKVTGSIKQGMISRK